MSRRTHIQGSLLVAIAALSALVAGCKVDDNYRIDDISKLDTEMTFFQDGAEIPLISSSPKIGIDSLLNLGKNDMSNLKTAADGKLSLEISGPVDLDKQLADLDLSKLASIDGASYKVQFEQKIMDSDADLSIKGTSVVSEMPFGNVSALSDITVPSVDRTTSFKTGLSAYSAADKMDLTSSMTPVTRETVLIDKSKNVNPMIDRLPASDVEQSVQSYLSQTTVNVEEDSSTKIKLASISLNDNISSVSGIKLSSSAKLNIKVSLLDCFLTKANVLTNISMDLSKVLKLSGVSGAVKLDKTLTQDNNWTNEYSYTVTGLAKDSFTGSKIEFEEAVPVSGTLSITDAYTTVNKFRAGKDIRVKIEISYADFKIVSAMAELAKPISIDCGEPVSVDLNIPSTEVPSQIRKIDVKFSQDKAIDLKIASSGLSELKGLMVSPSVNLTFPEGLVVKGAKDGKMTISGDLASADIAEKIQLETLSLVPAGGKVSYNGKITLQTTAQASGSIDIAKLPSSPDKDATVTASIKGTPAIADYDITLDPITQDVTDGSKVSVPVTGLDKIDFGGAFSLFPAGTPAITLNTKMPAVDGLEFATAQDGIRATFPEFVVFNASKIDPALNFDASTNSIVIKGAIPETITLPVEKFHMKPVTKDGSKIVEGDFKISGKMLATAKSGTVNKAAVDAIAKQKVTINVTVPDMKAKSIALEGDIAFDVETQTDDIVFLKAADLPKEVVSINKVDLDNVVAKVSGNISGLPQIQGNSYRLEADITLPEFVTPSKISINQVLDPKNPVIDFSEQIKSFDNIKLDGKDVKGRITVKGKLTLSDAQIGLDDLKGTIKGELNASINGPDGKIKIGKISANVDYNMASTETIAIDDLSKQLGTDELVLDVDPEITLAVNTNLGFPVKGTLVLTPCRGGEDITANAVEISGIELAASDDPSKTAESKFFVADSDKNCPAGAKYIKCDLSGVLKTMPDQIKAGIKIQVDPEKAGYIDPNATYTCKLEYKICIPLSFGDEFKVSSSTETELDSVSDVLKMGEFTLKGKFVNTTPLNILLDAQLADQSGTVIQSAKTNSINIAGCAVEGQPKESDFSFVLSVPAADADKVKKLKLRYTVKATPGIQVNKNDYIQIKDVAIVISKGVTVSPTNK